MNKVGKHTKEPNMVTTTTPQPFDVISIDTVGPLPKTRNDNRYCITIQCDLTKYVVIIPVQNKEAPTIARALVENFILTYGKFLELKSDQGTEYNNDILKQIGKILKFKQNFATAYHPQTIGALERNHRCLNEYLRSFSNEHHDD
jgi:IS30 family transposase